MGLLDGFEIVRTYKERPFITLRDTTINFSKLAVEQLAYTPYVHMYLDKQNKRVAYQACEKDSSAIAFYKEPKEGKQMLVRLAGKANAQALMDLAGIEDCGNGIRIYGDYYKEEKVIIFDLNNREELGK